MKRTLMTLAVCLMFLVVAIGMASANPRYTIKLGLANEPDHYHAIACQKFAELVFQKTGGEVVVQVFPSQQLGTEPEMISQTSMGTIQMFNASPGHVGGYVKEFQVMLCPYIWRDYEHLQKTMEGPIGQELADAILKQYGIRILDFLWVNGPRHLTTANKAVYRPEDLRGMKIRAPQAPIYIAAVRSLGANPVPIDFGELYMALQQGVVDGQENALGTIDSRKFYEVQKFVMLTGHIYQSQIMGINDRFFRSLPARHQQAITEAMREARDFNNKLQLEADEVAAEKFRKLGLTIIKPEVELFRQNSRNFVKELESLWGPGLYDRIVAVR